MRFRNNVPAGIGILRFKVMKIASELFLILLSTVGFYHTFLFVGMKLVIYFLNVTKCCHDYEPEIKKIDSYITTETARTGKLYDGKPFKFCPWCGCKR